MFYHLSGVVIDLKAKLWNVIMIIQDLEFNPLSPKYLVDEQKIVK